MSVGAWVFFCKREYVQAKKSCLGAGFVVGKREEYVRTGEPKQNFPAEKERLEKSARKVANFSAVNWKDRADSLAG